MSGAAFLDGLAPDGGVDSRRFATEIASAAAGLAGVGRDPADLEAAARAFLGTLAEPGDGVLGRAVATLGAAGAASLVHARADPRELIAALVDAGDATGDALDVRTAEAALKRWLPRADPAAFERSLAQAARVGARLVVPGDRWWPAGLDDLGVHAPLALWVRGDPAALGDDEGAIALVGARAATSYGEHVTAEAAAGLSDRGFTIVSGGAYGIDGMAHRSTLASDGRTVAFLAGGVDRFYPLGHESLLSRIVETGAVASEVPCGSAPTKWRFLQRNRLIAASTAATVVVEAGWRSGSLNTAAHAAALGRALGAVPGPVTSPASAGCHRLLREYDAVCVTDAEQMAELAGGAPRRGASATDGPESVALAKTPVPSGPLRGRHPVSPEAARLLDVLSTRSPREVDDLAVRSGLEPKRVMGLLGVLEAEGRVVRRSDGWVMKRV